MTTTSQPQAERRDALTGRLFQAMTGTMDLLSIYLGDRLGLYRALREVGPATPADLAARAGVDERYAREWLEQQAVTGLLDVAAPAPEGPDGAGRRYALPPGHAEVLVDRDSLSYLAYLGRFAVALGATAPAVRDAFRSGGGVSWDAFGPDAREGQGEQNRPIFLHLLGREWLPAIPDVDRRLRAAPQARVADVACGVGWSSIAVALAYPDVLVDGFDLDAPSVEIARRNAAEAGVAGRVRFHVRDAAGPELAGRYDLVLICEALHDLSRPVEALRTMRSLARAGGAVLVVDEKVAETFTAPGDDLERLYFGFSVLCCLATGMAEQPSAATGTVMRPATLRRYAEGAGFRAVEVLPIEHDLFRLYRLLGE
jgi:2-polyprenyl-3-methyl-5-hydroxy-6-metoxy-1,4-benzoquinol methylase